MLLPHPSPMERHILDLLDRIDRMQAERIGVLEDGVRALEAQNDALRRRTGELRARLDSQDRGITALSASLANYLVPPELPPA